MYSVNASCYSRLLPTINLELERTKSPGFLSHLQTTKTLSNAFMSNLIKCSKVEKHSKEFDLIFHTLIFFKLEFSLVFSLRDRKEME